MCPESGPQPHAGHAGETRQYGRDPSGAAWPRPRSFRVEPSHEKTKNAPTNFFRRMEGSGGLRWQSQAAAPRVAEFDQLRRAATPKAVAKIRSVRDWAPLSWTDIVPTTHSVAFPPRPPITAQFGTMSVQ